MRGEVPVQLAQRDRVGCGVVYTLGGQVRVEAAEHVSDTLTGRAA